MDKLIFILSQLYFVSLEQEINIYTCKDNHHDGRETPHRTPEAVPQPTTPSTGTTPQHSAEPIIGPRIESTNTGGKVTSTT